MGPMSCLMAAVLLTGPALDEAVAPGLSNSEVAERAEAEFREGVKLREAGDRARPHFRKAADLFAELRRRGANNALLLRNLGNAYLLADDLPHALLAYRQGVRLSPQDPDLQTNLAQARDLVVYPPDSNLGRPLPDNHPPWLPRAASGWTVLAAAGLYTLAWVFLTRWLMTRRGCLLVLGAGVFLGAVALSALLIVAVRQEVHEEGRALVVVAADGVLLRKGNGKTYPARFPAALNRGVEARLLFERDGWLQVELAAGEVGWIPASQALVDRSAGP